MFLGEYIHRIDYKRRIAIPPKYLEELGGEVYIVESPDECLCLFPLENLEEVKKEFEGLHHPEKVKIRKAKGSRMVLLSEESVRYAGLKKEVVIAGCGNHIEVWNPKRWKRAKREAKKEEVAILSE